jgi:urease accessory protein
VLDDGSIVLVTGEAEKLIEISAGSALDTVRLAWHLGNRHTDVQIVADKLRIRRDHVLEEMLIGLGAHLHAVDAVFDPESPTPSHEHGHGHHHGG